MSFILLGILNSQAAGAVGGGTYDLLETTVLGSDTASVSFTSLNSTYGSTYKHLQLRLVTKATTLENQYLQFNGDTGTNYKGHFLFGDGSSVGSGSPAATNYIYIGNSSSTTNQFNGIVVDILDAFDSTKNTTVRAMYASSGTPNVVQLLSGAWFDTSALDSILVDHKTGNYSTGSRFSLYGIRAA